MNTIPYNKVLKIDSIIECAMSDFGKWYTNPEDITHIALDELLTDCADGVYLIRLTDYRWTRIVKKETYPNGTIFLTACGADCLTVLERMQ